MAKLSYEEIDELAEKYVRLRDKAEKTGDKTDILRFESYKNICIQKLKQLVEQRVFKYKQFSNYKDLKQDGFEALISAFRTFDPKKGSFSWWAGKYIKTRISRTANAHSTIKYPIAINPFENMERLDEANYIKEAIAGLSDQQRLVINMKYGFNGVREYSVGDILTNLSISRLQYTKILSEAEEHIKRYLLRVE
jgi:RNA polymerase sigma factor (sigma-70 family)